MEIINPSVLEDYGELIQSLIRLKPHLILPEHVARFRKQIDSIKSRTPGGAPGNADDYQFLFRVFIILAHHETPPTMGELSNELNIPVSTATRIVDWLVVGKFVERLTDPDDRRVIRIRMTPTGQAYYDLTVQYIQQRIGQLLQVFSTAEQAEFYRLLCKLMEAFKSEGDINS